jgi:hypothetical protein
VQKAIARRHTIELNPLKIRDLPTWTPRSAFFTAQRNTLERPVLGMDGLSNLKKTFF